MKPTILSIIQNPMVDGNFTHSIRTNLKKKTLTNHDACAWLLYVNGPMNVKQLREELMRWRLGEVLYVQVPRFVWDSYARRMRQIGMKRVPKMWFTYLFNTSIHGGYGFVGDAPDSHKNDCRGWNWWYPNTINKQSGADLNYVENNVRRVYWWRMGHGLYAPTVECFRRMNELGFS